MPKEIVSLADLQRSYHQTYLIYKDELYWSEVTVAGARETPVVHLRGVGAAGAVTPETAHILDLNKKQFKDAKLDAPALGWMQAPGGALIYLQRNIRRQYKFGIHQHNCDYYSVQVAGGPALLVQRFTAHSDQFRLSMMPKYRRKYDPRLATQCLTRQYAVINNFLYQDIYCIGQRKNGVFTLNEGEDDSITEMDLKELGVPLE